MSLGVAIKGPEGVVLACDSRVTLSAQKGDGPPINVYFDNATKLLAFQKQGKVGVVTYGAAVIGLRTAQSYVPEFELRLDDDQMRIEDFAKALSDFYLARWNENQPNAQPGVQVPPMSFIVAGYDPGAPYGTKFVIDIPHNPEPSPRNPGDDNFGMTWGGQLNVVSRLIHGYDPNLLVHLAQRDSLSKEEIQELQSEFKSTLEYQIPYQVLPLQDCVNLATFLVRTTMTAQDLAIVLRGVGGMVEVATVTQQKGLQFVQRKSLRGEAGLAAEGAGGY